MGFGGEGGGVCFSGACVSLCGSLRGDDQARRRVLARRTRWKTCFVVGCEEGSGC